MEKYKHSVYFTSVSQCNHFKAAHFEWVIQYLFRIIAESDVQNNRWNQSENLSYTLLQQIFESFALFLKLL